MKKKFSAAFNGMKLALHSKSIITQLIFACIAIAVAVFLKFTDVEWFVVGVCIMVVVSLEILNEAIEILCDRITLEQDKSIKKVKDISAAAVLFASIVSLIIGMIMVINHL